MATRIESTIVKEAIMFGAAAATSATPRFTREIVYESDGVAPCVPRERERERERGVVVSVVSPYKRRREPHLLFIRDVYSTVSSVLRNNDTRQASSSKDGARKEGRGGDGERAFRKSALVW